MSTPSDGSGSPWQSPDQSAPAQTPNPQQPNAEQPNPQQPHSQQPSAERPNPQRPAPAQPAAPVGSGYGSPSSPWYGKFGQGEALPTPQAPPGQQSGNGQQGWNGQPGQQGWNGQPGQQGWNGQPGGNGQQGWNGQQGQQGWNGQQNWNPQQGPTAVQSFGRLTVWVPALSVLFGVSLCLTAALAPNQHHQFHDFFTTVQAAQDTGSSTPATFHLAPGSAAYRLVSVFNILLEVAAWVVGALWLTRARQNALFLRPGGQRRSESWVWLAWIIPVVNLWFPWQLLKDTVTATAAATGERPIRTWTWWTAWLVALIFTASVSLTTVLPPNHALHLSLIAISAVLMLTALVLWLRLVRWITTRQEALAADRPVTTLQG